MGYVVVGFLGVVLGAAAAAGAALLFLQRAADRDLVERRLRALLSYRDTLGAPAWLQAGGRGPAVSPEPEELEQLLHNLDAVAREFRLTAWIFDESLRAELARSLLAFEEEVRRARGRGERPSGIRIADSYRELELTLREAAARGVREFRRWRSWPSRTRSAISGGAEPGDHLPEGLGADLRDIKITRR